ncbi:MAG: TolC family outer membrane protein [Amaricoccus sp.]
MAQRKRRADLLSTALVAVLMVAPGMGRAETLSDALIKAYQTSPLLQSARAALRAQDENIPQASSSKKLQSNLSGNATGETSSDNTNEYTEYYDAGLNATLLVYDHGQTKAAIESARMSSAAGRADLIDVEQQVLFAAVTAYMDVRQALEFVAIAKNDVGVLEEQLRAANNRFDVGEVTRTDVSLTEAQLESSRAQQVTAQGNLETSRAAYLAAVGTLPGDLAPPPPLPQLVKSMKEAEALAMRQNPGVIAAQFAERAAIANFDRALAAKGPSVSLTGFAGYQGHEQLGVGDKLSANAGVSGSIPLTTGGNLDSLIRQAQQTLDQRKSQVQEAGRSAVQSADNAWTQLKTAQATILANKRQVEASRIAYEGVAEEARLGARSTIDVLTANQDRLQAEAEVVRSTRDEYVAGYSVLQSMGLLTVQHLKLGIETYDPNEYFLQIRNGPRGGYDTSAVDRIRSRWGQD